MDEDGGSPHLLISKVLTKIQNKTKPRRKAGTEKLRLLFNSE